jgi:hypothetical protein
MILRLSKNVQDIIRDTANLTLALLEILMHIRKTVLTLT